MSDVPVTSPNGVATSIHSSVGALELHGCIVQLTAPGPSLNAGRTTGRTIRSISVPRRDYRLPLFRSATIRRDCAGVDLVHVHTLGPLGWSGWRAACNLGVPAVMTWHTDVVAYAAWYFDVTVGALCAPKTARPGWSPAQLRRVLLGKPGYRDLLRDAVHRSISQFDLVIVPSEKSRESLPVATGGPPIVVIPTAVDLPMPAVRDPHVLRLSLMLPPRARIVLSVGRATPEKNPLLLLEAFARVHRTLPDTILLMVGPGTQRGWLTRMIERLGITSAVLRRPPVAHSRISAYYLAANLLVFASQTDTQGLVIDEAEAAGLPVLMVDERLAHSRQADSPRAVTTAESTALGRAIVELLRTAAVTPAPSSVSPDEAEHRRQAFGAALLDAYRSCRRSWRPRGDGLRPLCGPQIARGVMNVEEGVPDVDEVAEDR